MLEQARQLAESGELDQAWALCNQALLENPESGRALILASFIFEKKGCAGLAYNIAKRITDLFPKEAAGYTNLGRCADVMWRMDEALEAYDKAILWSKTKESKVAVLVNQAAVYVQLGRFERARRYSEKALEIEPENRKAQHNLGISKLAAREWDGWKWYRGSLGSANRLCWKYHDEPDWNGEAGKRVVIFGEQGIGDEINAASMVNEVIERSEKVILDCDARLANLYRRSFPRATVYGTRNAKTLDWAPEDQKPDASLACMQVGEFLRTKDADFHRKPYLVADPERVSMWKHLWSSKGPVVGVAWTGGVPSTGAGFRRWSLEDLRPVLELGAHFVCLQYKDASKEIAEFKAKTGIQIHQYPHATLTPDYDDTAALVASLDGVVAMDTSVVHLAGALGVPCVVGVPRAANWRWGEKYQDQLWYGSVRIVRQGAAWPMDTIRGEVAKWL